jgi:hypothetical protein
MKYAIEMGSGAIKIGSAFQELIVTVLGGL